MEPITATTIAALAFKKAFEKTIEKFTEATWNKIDALRKKIWDKLAGNEEAKKALTATETGSKESLQLVAQYLDSEMQWDENFAQEVKNLARDIQQEIEIGEMRGENIQNVYGGEGNQYNNKFQGLQNSSISIHYNNSDS